MRQQPDHDQIHESFYKNENHEIYGVADPTSIVTEWSKFPSRKIFIVDETRIPDPSVGQVIVFTCICDEAGKILACMSKASALREALPMQSQKVVIKGQSLLGSRAKKSTNPFLVYALEAIRGAKKVAFVTATSKHLREDSWIGSAKITPSVDSDGIASSNVVSGPELGLLLTFIKQVANDLGATNEQIDVIIDRSAQLGFDPNQRGISREQFEVFGPGTFNKNSSGDNAKLQCPAHFKIITNSDQGIFRDLLLLPDVAGYMGKTRGTLERPIKDAIAGKPFVVWYAKENQVFETKLIDLRMLHELLAVTVP